MLAQGWLKWAACNATAGQLFPVTHKTPWANIYKWTWRLESLEMFDIIATAARFASTPKLYRSDSASQWRHFSLSLPPPPPPPTLLAPARKESSCNRVQLFIYVGIPSSLSIERPVTGRFRIWSKMSQMNGIYFWTSHQIECQNIQIFYPFR